MVWGPVAGGVPIGGTLGEGTLDLGAFVGGSGEPGSVGTLGKTGARLGPGWGIVWGGNATGIGEGTLGAIGGLVDDGEREGTAGATGGKTEGVRPLEIGPAGGTATGACGWFETGVAPVGVTVGGTALGGTGEGVGPPGNVTVGCCCPG